ncbi:MAG: hypothetical protein C0399_12810 [Syntrophus sp. (in: bacteria)]|nr:hypothetical protein [Syntrophus sp. (in: bacteria)]
MTSLQSELEVAMARSTDDKTVTAEAVLSVLEKSNDAKERIDLLAFALTRRDAIERRPERAPEKGIDRERWDRLLRTHAELVRGHLKLAFSKANNVHEFAAMVTNMLEMFESREERVFAVAVVLFSQYVPFVELPKSRITMSTEKYNALLKSNNEFTEKIRFIVQVPFDDLVDEADRVLQVLDDCKDRDLRVALLAVYTGMTAKEMARGMIERAKERE